MKEKYILFVRVVIASIIITSLLFYTELLLVVIFKLKLKLKLLTQTIRLRQHLVN